MSTPFSNLPIIGSKIQTKKDVALYLGAAVTIFVMIIIFLKSSAPFTTKIGKMVTWGLGAGVLTGGVALIGMYGYEEYTQKKTV